LIPAEVLSLYLLYDDQTSDNKVHLKKWMSEWKTEEEKSHIIRAFEPKPRIDAQLTELPTSRTDPVGRTPPMI
jgi:hypothetical protein